MSRRDGRRGTAELGNNGVNGLDPNQAAFLTEGAEVDALSSELVKESPPIGRWSGQQQRSGIDVEQLAAAGDLVLSVAVG